MSTNQGSTVKTIGLAAVKTFGMALLGGIRSPPRPRPGSREPSMAVRLNAQRRFPQAHPSEKACRAWHAGALEQRMFLHRVPTLAPRRRKGTRPSPRPGAAPRQRSVQRKRGPAGCCLTTVRLAVERSSFEATTAATEPAQAPGPPEMRYQKQRSTGRSTAHTLKKRSMQRAWPRTAPNLRSWPMK